MAGDLYLIPPERAYRFIINNPVDMSLSVSQRIIYQTILNSYIEKKLEIQSGFRIQPSGSDMNMLRSLVGIMETEVINRQRKCL